MDDDRVRASRLDLRLHKLHSHVFIVGRSCIACDSSSSGAIPFVQVERSPVAFGRKSISSIIVQCHSKNGLKIILQGCMGKIAAAVIHIDVFLLSVVVFGVNVILPVLAGRFKHPDSSFRRITVLFQLERICSVICFCSGVTSPMRPHCKLPAVQVVDTLWAGNCDHAVYRERLCLKLDLCIFRSRCSHHHRTVLAKVDNLDAFRCFRQVRQADGYGHKGLRFNLLAFRVDLDIKETGIGIACVLKFSCLGRLLQVGFIGFVPGQNLAYLQSRVFRNAGFGAVFQFDPIGIPVCGCIVCHQGIAKYIFRKAVRGEAEARDLLVFPPGPGAELQRVGNIGGNAVLHPVQAEILTVNSLLQVNLDVEPLVFLFVHVVQADAEHLVSSLFFRFRILHGSDRRVFLLAGQHLGIDAGFLRQVVVVHCADHGAVVFRGQFGIAGCGNSQDIFPSVLQGNGQGFGSLCFLQDPEFPAVHIKGEPEGFIVGNLDTGNALPKGCGFFFGHDLQAGENICYQNVLRTGKITGIFLVSIMEYNRILQHKFTEVRCGEGEPGNPVIFPVDVQSVPFRDCFHLDIILFIRMDMIKLKGHAVDNSVFLIQKQDGVVQLNIHIIFFRVHRAVGSNLKSSKTGIRIRNRLC